MTDEKVFWMVYVKGMNLPRVRHSTMLEAQTEAERLCRQEKRLVYVLKAEHFVSLAYNPTEWFLLKENDND